MTKKRYWIPLLLIITLTGLRLYLPTWLKNHTNQVLSDLPGYHGSVGAVGVSLWRGAYTISDLALHREGAKTELPFIVIPQADVSIQWKAMISGEVVSEIYLNQPQITYIYEDHQVQGQTTSEVGDWTDALDELVPIKINHIQVKNGKIGLVQLSTDPNIDLYIDRIELTANNLQLVKQNDNQLPSTLNVTGVTIGQGKLKLDAKADLIRIIPNIDLNASVENISLQALNPLTQHYAKVDVVTGNLNLFSEIAISDGYLKGYFKPLMSNVELIDQSDGFFEKLWEGTVNLFKFIFKNHKTDKLATKIPIEGDLNQMQTSAWETFVNILSNAFVRAFKGEVDGDININDAIEASESNDEKGK